VQTPVVLPELGASPIHLSLWLVRPGARVRAGESLAEVIVPGATFDVSAPVGGRLVEWRAWPGDELEPNQVLAVIEVDDAGGT
jgi:pyruvate/2-oxoglutarate dehydrogenase complex dihydrolipoamide acyltransferase (E2) component